MTIYTIIRKPVWVVARRRTDKTVPHKTVPDKTVPNSKIFPDKSPRQNSHKKTDKRVPDKIVRTKVRVSHVHINSESNPLRHSCDCISLNKN